MFQRTQPIAGYWTFPLITATEPSAALAPLAIFKQSEYLTYVAVHAAG
jgi:hypothetical protein